MLNKIGLIGGGNIGGFCGAGNTQGVAENIAGSVIPIKHNLRAGLRTSTRRRN